MSGRVGSLSHIFKTTFKELFPIENIEIKQEENEKIIENNENLNENENIIKTPSSTNSKNSKNSKNQKDSKGRKSSIKSDKKTPRKSKTKIIEERIIF